MARRFCGRAWIAAQAAALGPPPPEPSPTPSDVTRLVRHARRQARLSQRGLAARAGVAQSTVAEIEMGRVDPKTGTIAKLLAACNCRLVVAPAVDTDVAAEDPPDTPQALTRRLDKDPQQRLEAAGPAVMGLVARIVRDSRDSGAEPILIGALAELVWGADRQPSTARLCARPADLDTLAARAGPYEVELAPPGTAGWSDLRRAATRIRVGSRPLLVASLDDLIRIRRSMSGDADRAGLAELEALVAAIEATERREAAGRPRFPAHWDVRPVAHLDLILQRGRVRDYGWQRGRRQRTLTGFCS